ncbi:hypothetical protein RYX36_029852 [Vicia faba]
MAYLIFCNLNLPIIERAKDIVSKLTLDEKLSQLVNTAPSIPRLGIPSYQWWSEALHGVGNAGKGIRLNGNVSIKAATSFPQVILTAASFDPKLWYQINPLVNSKYTVSYVRGLQGDSFEGGELVGDRLQASACCKHFTAYDLDNWNGLDRFDFDSNVTLQDLTDTYQPPFHSCIKQGRSSGIMCAYNRVNGVPNCADFNLLTKTARQKWNFNGYITSDCAAVAIIHDRQGYAKTPEDAVADTLKAGMDVECAYKPITNPLTKSYSFCNLNLPIIERAKDIVSKLTLDEKLSQLVNTTPSIPRLGIPSYQWWSEALHGVANAGKGIRLNGNVSIKAATSFPQVILTAASFDPKLWYQISKVIGTEARGVYNAGQAEGMTFWAPNINIFRDPRWERGQETAGEDPLVNLKYAVSYVRGLQGDSFEGGELVGDRLQASACCKHFTAYDLDHWNGLDRFDFDANVTLQDLTDTYQPPFHSCIQQGRSSGIMCAYNRVNGVPNCADFNLLTKTARQKWNFNGYITSDCAAVAIIHDRQGYAKTPEDAVADTLKAGMDVECDAHYVYDIPQRM